MKNASATLQGYRICGKSPGPEVICCSTDYIYSLLLWTVTWRELGVNSLLQVSSYVVKGETLLVSVFIQINIEPIYIRPIHTRPSNWFEHKLKWYMRQITNNWFHDSWDKTHYCGPFHVYTACPKPVYGNLAVITSVAGHNITGHFRPSQHYAKGELRFNMGGSRGFQGVWTPLFGPRCRLFNIGPKIGPPFFVWRPKIAPPPLRSAPGFKDVLFRVCLGNLYFQNGDGKSKKEHHYCVVIIITDISYCHTIDCQRIIINISDYHRMWYMYILKCIFMCFLLVRDCESFRNANAFGETWEFAMIR